MWTLRQKSTKMSAFKKVDFYYVKKVPFLERFKPNYHPLLRQKSTKWIVMKNFPAIASKKYQTDMEILRGLLRQKSTDA